MSNLVNHATDEMRDYVDAQANDTTVPEGGELVDDSWLDELEPYTPDPAPQQTAPQQEQPPADTSAEAQDQRMKELLKGMEHIDEEVADEVLNKLVKPVTSQLEAEVNDLKRRRAEEDEQRRLATLRDVNAKIRAHHPKSDKILASRAFVDFVNSETSPYASEQNFDILSRAYYAGDAQYVITWLDKFVQSRGKPKPSIGVEMSQTGGGNEDAPERRKGMTDAEYRKKRQIIRAAPPGTYPHDALARLAEEYSKGRA